MNSNVMSGTEVAASTCSCCLAITVHLIIPFLDAQLSLWGTLAASAVLPMAVLSINGRVYGSGAYVQIGGNAANIMNSTLSVSRSSFVGNNASGESQFAHVSVRTGNYRAISNLPQVSSGRNVRQQNTCRLWCSVACIHWPP